MKLLTVLSLFTFAGSLLAQVPSINICSTLNPTCHNYRPTTAATEMQMCLMLEEYSGKKDVHSNVYVGAPSIFGSDRNDDSIYNGFQVDYKGAYRDLNQEVSAGERAAAVEFCNQKTEALKAKLSSLADAPYFILQGRLGKSSQVIGCKKTKVEKFICLQDVKLDVGFAFKTFNKVFPDSKRGLKKCNQALQEVLSNPELRFVDVPKCERVSGSHVINSLVLVREY